MPTLISVSVLGNTGLPTTTSGHIPSIIQGIALSASGHIFTANDWDEPHFDIAVYDPATGYVTGNYGHPITESNVDKIALDTTYAYVSGYLYNLGTPYPLVVYRVNLNTAAVDNFTTAGRHITVNTLSGNNFWIPIALFGSTIYISDPVGARIVAYDKVTGSQTSTWAVTTPGPIATDGSGNIWVGAGTSVKVYSSAGTLLATPITGLSYVSAISIAGMTLAIADSNASVSRVLTYTLSGTTATLSTTFGQLTSVGSAAPKDFGFINAVALTADSHVIVADGIAAPANVGSRLQKFDLSGNLGWTQTDMVFQAAGYYSPANPNVLLTTEEQTFSLNHSTQTATWTGCGNTDQGYFGATTYRVGGPCKVVTLGGNDFFYRSSGQYAGIAVYRVVPQGGGKGPALQFASCLANSQPSPDGVFRNFNSNLWSWHCTTGPGLTSIAAGASSLPGTGLTVDQASAGSWYWFVQTFGVDDAGTIWIASITRSFGAGIENAAIWKIPLNSLNAAGNPIYHWADAVEVLNTSALAAAMGVAAPVVQMVNYSATDNLIYVLFNNSDGITIPAFMDGNVLAAFIPAGALVWKVILPYVAAGMSPIPGGNGGVVIGGNNPFGGAFNGNVDFYNSSGVKSLTASPPAALGGTGIDLPCGLFDMWGAINAQRAPDGSLDIFAEDDYNGRLIWYRVSDLAPSYPVLFHITCVQSGLSSLGLPVWTVTAPWGFISRPNLMEALQQVVWKAGAQYGGRMQAYLVNGITNNTEVGAP